MKKTYTTGDKISVKQWKKGKQGSVSLGKRVIRKNSQGKFYITHDKTRKFISRIIDGKAYVN